MKDMDTWTERDDNYTQAVANEKKRSSTVRRLHVGDRVRFQWSGQDYVVSSVAPTRALADRVREDGTTNPTDQLVISLNEGSIERPHVISLMESEEWKPLTYEERAAHPYLNVGEYLEPEPTDFDQAQAEIATNTAHASGMAFPPVAYTGSTLEGRLEPTADVLARLEPTGSERQSYAYRLGQAQGTADIAALRAARLITELAITREQTSSDFIAVRLNRHIEELKALRDMFKTISDL